MARSTSPNVTVPDSPVAAANGTTGMSEPRSAAVNLFVSLRPEQWTKNLLVFAAVIFAQELFNRDAVLTSIVAFLIFCVLSGVVYLLNDVMDRESDRRHPIKRHRPIASGRLSPATALIAATILCAGSVAAAFAVNRNFGIVAVGYVALQAFYSGPLKHVVIVDVLTLAIGFVLRAVAGAVAIDVVISHWLFACTILLASFIALAKRRHELLLLGDEAAGHRPILGEYSPYLLDQMIVIVASATLIAYIFYTISAETVAKFGTQWLGLTIPFPLYGLFRYLYLVHRREGGGSPSDLLLNDRPLLGCVVLWVIAVVVIIYEPF
jgi:4-hydroxybenzoate polyprenyltransferase